MTLSGRLGDDHPGGGGMSPNGAVVALIEERCTCTNGEAGFEVTIKEGKRAMCCAENGAGTLCPAVSGAERIDEVEGAGEGGKRILFSDSALPFDLFCQPDTMAFGAVRD